MSKILGIDPGQAGGMAIIDNGTLVECVAMPSTEHDINDFFERNKDVDVAYLEQVHSMPQQGVASTFKFGVSYGFLRGILVANKIPFEDVTPMKWQKALGMNAKKGETKIKHKNDLKGKAQQLFPKQKFTLKNCDAALIAYYGYKKN